MLYRDIIQYVYKGIKQTDIYTALHRSVPGYIYACKYSRKLKHFWFFYR